MPILLDTSTPLTLAEILGSAIASVIDAQAQSARATVEFIKEVGIVPPTVPGAEEKLRTLQFGYRKLDENQKEADFVVDIPLLGMVNIPMVSVKNATFSFAYEIVDTKASQKDTAKPVAETSFLSRVLAPAKLQGRVSRAPASTGSEKATLQIKVELEKSAMPLGLERILDILELSASERKKQVSNP